MVVVRPVKPGVDERRRYPQNTGEASAAHHAVRRPVLLEQCERTVSEPGRVAELDADAETLNGTPEMRPLWQKGVDYVDAYLGDAAGRLYVKHSFPAESKAKVQALVRDLIAAFNKRIDGLNWMTPETKAKAKEKEKEKEKVATLRVGVGYKWVNYSGLQIAKGDALGNAQRASLFEYQRQVAKLQKAPDLDEWWITPQTVNALNLLLQNALNFPAAILQEPFFDRDANAAHNYGAVGTVIGHEISHRFDDEGSYFDAQGRLANWWTAADMDHFKSAAEKLAGQFDQYRPFADLAVNGHQTLSENIADLGGLMAASDAYHSTLGGNQDAVKQGLTGDQRFFVSYGQNWRSKVREAMMRRLVTTDGHAPEQYRADSVRNVDGWYEAFGA
jgi:putative endopeptidase